MNVNSTTSTNWADYYNNKANNQPGCFDSSIRLLGESYDLGLSWAKGTAVCDKFKDEYEQYKVKYQDDFKAKYSYLLESEPESTTETKTYDGSSPSEDWTITPDIEAYYGIKKSSSSSATSESESESKLKSESASKTTNDSSASKNETTDTNASLADLIANAIATMNATMTTILSILKPSESK